MILILRPLNKYNKHHWSNNNSQSVLQNSCIQFKMNADRTQSGVDNP